MSLPWVLLALQVYNPPLSRITEDIMIVNSVSPGSPPNMVTPPGPPVSGKVEFCSHWLETRGTPTKLQERRSSEPREMRWVMTVELMGVTSGGSVVGGELGGCNTQGSGRLTERPDFPGSCYILVHVCYLLSHIYYRTGGCPDNKPYNMRKP